MVNAPSIARVRNHIGWRRRLAALRGSSTVFELGMFDAALDQVARLEREAAGLPDLALTEGARALAAAARAGTPLAGLRCRLFALAREASRRALGQRPFDEQVVAALALDDGAIVEMQTGEGKTLAAVMPAALHALAGRGVHVLTVNDYLARRDAAWMGPIYRALGLSVAFVQQGMAPGDRRQAYRSDITYVTAKEAGFDHLRDQLAASPGAVVHRGYYIAIVDEADSLLVDEARVPLVIAGSGSAAGSTAPRLAAVIAGLTPGLHFDLDEYARDVELTEAGIERVERELRCGALHGEANLTLLSQVNCALHARALLHRDVDYIVRAGRIELVDEFTGRVVDDRHWPDGLQAALEAKEGLALRDGGRILGSTTLQRFVHGYERLCGMTGTAQDAADELFATYGAPVVVIPTHRPVARLDRPDLIFTHREAKERAVVREVQRAHESGRPALVGTRTVAESERLARRLRDARVPCAVLNARHDAEEARIVARAGAIGAVTIATNMAGRGTDIRLGGEHEADRDRVAALGGLYVIGTNRHESRRVDLQLRGRAGRQGDPGESRFFLSLEDDLLVRYGLRDLVPQRLQPAASDDPIDHPVLRREIARAQRIIEGQDFEIRRTLARYASVLDDQHRLFGVRRQALLHGAAPNVWQEAPAQRAALVAAAGEEAVQAAERTVTLFHMDRLWSEHLSRCADLREGIHLVRLGGQDPLSRYRAGVIQAFAGLDEAIDAAVIESIERVTAARGTVDLSGVGIAAPASTWTYLVNDDPFKDQLGLMLMGPGGTTVAMYAAVVLAPLLVAWGLVDRFVKKQVGRRTPRSDNEE
jgi:preprotein translocase subunit SecA